MPNFVLGVSKTATAVIDAEPVGLNCGADSIWWTDQGIRPLPPVSSPLSPRDPTRACRFL